MKSDKIYRPLTVEKGVLDIVKECFRKENLGDLDARVHALDELDKFLIKTYDGSVTLKSNNLDDNETMHTYHGGLDESYEKYVKPSNLSGKDDVRVLDICSGLGYTAAVCLDYLIENNTSIISLDMVEISPSTLATSLIIPSPIKSHEIIKKAIEDELYLQGYLKHRMVEEEIPDNIQINVHIEDAREIVRNPGNNELYDAIFLIPFSPPVSPELYTLEFIKGLGSLLKPDGILPTYTASTAVRYALINTGLHVGLGPRFNRSGGTIASQNPDLIETPLSLSQERMIALTDAGIPFRDPELKENGKEIAQKRQIERINARKTYKFASTVQSPVYLCQDISESRLKRRVLKDIRRHGFEDLESAKSKYIVCPQYRECICEEECQYHETSRDRVLEMEKRLNKIINED